MSLTAQAGSKTPKERASFTISPLSQLIFIGLGMQVIYLIYVVAFPLIANTQKGGPAADLEILMRDYRWFAAIYVAGLFLLYYLFWRAVKIGLEIKSLALNTPSITGQVQGGFSGRHLKVIILSFGLLFGFTLIWLYPITAYDLFLYVLRGRVWAVYGESPMLIPITQFPADPYLDFGGEFADNLSNYGPLWEILVQGPFQLGATGMVSGVISIKLLVLAAYGLCAGLIGWVAQPQGSTNSSLAALIFFAWNPLILMQGAGNGHNDVVFILFMVLGVVLWQRNLWWAAAAALTLAVLAKVAALFMIPLFAVALLRNETTWPERILKGLGSLMIGLVLAYTVYSIVGPLTETFQGMTALTVRRGFAIASVVRMVQREVIPWNVAEIIPRTTAQYIFILFYLWLLWELWRKRLDLVTAGFLAFFAQLMLGRTFRIWYPMWLIPLAALHLTPATFWRAFLFGLTAELSIFNYFVVWRWWLRDLPWGKLNMVNPSPYWPVMHVLTVPWVFGIPLFGPILMKWWQRREKKYQEI